MCPHWMRASRRPTRPATEHEGVHEFHELLRVAGALVQVEDLTNVRHGLGFEVRPRWLKQLRWRQRLKPPLEQRHNRFVVGELTHFR
jgi:hypothetical protein